MSTVKSSKTVIVCSVGSAPYFSQSFFEQLGTNTVRVGSGEDLIRELGAIRPIGVLLLAGDADSFKGSAWLSQLEQKMLFEGLRVVLAVKDESVNPARLFGSKIRGPFHLVRCLGLRDLIRYGDAMTYKDTKRALERIRFSFGLSFESPFREHFRLLAEHSELVELGIPGRISEVEDDVHVILESAVYLQPGSRVVLRMMGFGDDPVDVPATALENLPSGLRFNFGNSIKARVDESHSHVLSRLVSVEDPRKIINRPLRRAMVLTRSVTLRQRVVTALALKQVESRIPLVRRNIKGDLPPLQPDFLLIEPAALGASSAAEGLKEVHDYLDLAGPKCHAVILGKRPDWNLLPSHRIHVVSVNSASGPTLGPELDALLSAREPKPGQTIWFAPDAPCAKIFLLLRERSVSVADEGLVIETPQVFRMWSNVEVRGLDSKAHFVGRVASVSRKEDWFRSQLRLGPRTDVLYTVDIASIASNPTLERTYQESLTKLRQPSAPLSPRSANTAQSLHRKGPSRSGTHAGSARVSDSIANVALDAAPEYGRTLAKKRRDEKESRRSMVGMLIIIVVVLGIVLAALLSGNENQKVYEDSFSKLFEKRSSESKKAGPLDSER